MPRTRENVIAELDARKIGYNDEMSHQELLALLKKAEKAEKDNLMPSSVTFVLPEPPVRASSGAVEVPIDYSNVRCGLSTIQDLHRRITILERKNAVSKSE